MTATTRAQGLSTQFAQLQEQAVAVVSGVTGEQWQRVTEAEGWTVAATAHHLAIVQEGFLGMVEKLAGGDTFSPTTDMDAIHEENVRHAREYAAVDKDETLEILEASGAAMTGLLQRFDDSDLERTAGNFGGNELSVAQVIEYVVIGHAREHLTSIQNSIAG